MEQVARGLKAALSVTSTPFPQSLPQSPATPLPADLLGRILGASPSVKEDGIVSFEVPRAEQITLGGIAVSPYLNLAAPVSFQPYGGGQNAAAVVDFGMLASEAMGVVKVMRERKWGLYFSCQFKTGDSLELAREIRDGLNQTNSKLV
ncbi:MAG TPA: DUF1259 domain-containing protein [Bryobacteraceae bacterium]|nr:DUF1259 domain-containing protein [Bryobacteraceae bacterium]